VPLAVEGPGASSSRLVGATPEPRIIDPDEVWIRHVVRGTAGQPSAQLVARAYFVREDIALGADGANGRQGWQSAQTTAVLEGDGTFTIAFANVAGDDGILHRRRFRILTDPDYEPGEEWIEFWRDPNDLIFVGTPTDYEKTSSTVTLKGNDLAEVLSGSLSSELDVWDGHAPVDVLRHYSRLAVLALGTNLSGVTLTGAAGAWSAPYSQNVAAGALEGDCWTVEARVRGITARPGASGSSQAAIAVHNGATTLMQLECDLYEGKSQLVSVNMTGWTPMYGKRIGLLMPGDVSFRIVARYGHVFLFVAGELVADFRREPPYLAPSGTTAISVYAYGTGTTLAIDGFHAETLAPFATRGPEPVNRQTPGLPPATGLRARYWSAAVADMQEPSYPERRIWRVGEEPAADRREPTLNASGTAPNLPGAYAARWEGSIYLDLATSDRAIRVHATGGCRVYIGRTMRHEPLVSNWATWTPTEQTSGSLRTWLGTSEAGWYPLVVENVNDFTPATLTTVLEDHALSGTFAVVPQSRLSPYGCYSDSIKTTPHRKVLDDVGKAFGLQWRVTPMSLESGEFPGTIEMAPLLGRQTSVVIDDSDVGTQAQASGNALDAVDGLVVDAAGLADPKGSGQLSAQVVDYSRAVNHMALRQAYESLSEIGDEGLLKQRADSLLALRSSVNEQVGVRPRGQRDVVDLIPLTGAKAKLDWRPGDGVFLNLDSVDVQDESPRQMRSVQWQLRRDGVGMPTVGFRQRPRDLKTALRKLTSAVYGPRRTFQGQIIAITGSIGGTAGIDGYSRCPVGVASPDQIVKLVANVYAVSGTGWKLEVGAGAATVEIPGEVVVPQAVDVTAYLPASSGFPELYARMVGGTGSYALVLEALCHLGGPTT
jgi:hypothetical protein